MERKKGRTLVPAPRGAGCNPGGVLLEREEKNAPSFKGKRPSDVGRCRRRGPWRLPRGVELFLDVRTAGEVLAKSFRGCDAFVNGGAKRPEVEEPRW